MTEFVIVTGMSGAGKTSALKMMEDMGYFCIDNLPVQMMPGLIDLLTAPDSELKNVALGIDVRNGKALSVMDAYLNELESKNLKYSVLFLEASNRALIRRYKETRRQHPLEVDGRVDLGIIEERERMKFLKKRATYVVDTSSLLTKELRRQLQMIFMEGKNYKSMNISVVSFGFKNGIPQDADLVFDVRFLPNPYYDARLKTMTGNDPEVQKYVLDNEQGQSFLKMFFEMIDFLLPGYADEGKSQLIIAIGCTGGQHRSVTLANALYEHLTHQENYGVRLDHRDIRKDTVIKSF